MELLEQRLLSSYAWACHYANCCTASFSSTFDREELKSAGIVGYIVAASRFDGNKGSSFRGFCATRIRGAIMDELRRSTWQPRSARRNRQLIIKIGLDLEAELQRKPTRAELAEALGIAEADFAQMQRLSQPASYISLDDDSGSGFDDESLPLKETLADQSATPPSEACNIAEMRRALCSCISKLPPAEATVIVLHYLRNVPFQEIAQMMKLTPSRISQMHHHGLSLLKKLLQKKENGEF